MARKEAPIDGVPVGWWSLRPDGRMLCELCPRACTLADGQRGLCFVRARKGDTMVLTTYGRSSGFCIDPIEKKPLNHFLPGTSVLSFGTAGCNLACVFCQNWSMSKSREMDTLADQASPQAIARAAVEAGCASVAYTYNDPIIFTEYAIETAKACREAGVASVAVTAGYVCDAPRRAFFAEMDAANVDLKGFTEDFYRRHTKAELGAVKETLEYLVKHTKVWVEITTLLIPSENDSDAELHAQCAWIRETLGTHVPLHFSAFRPEYRMKDKDRTPTATLMRARRIAIEEGLRHVYVGNVVDEGRNSTWCSSCGDRVIGRAGYKISDYRLTPEGRCIKCGTPLPGRFGARAGEWGAKRQRLRIVGTT